MKNVVKELNFVEKIIVKIFRKTFIKIYKLGITFGYNNKQKSNAIVNAIGEIFLENNSKFRIKYIIIIKEK